MRKSITILLILMAFSIAAYAETAVMDGRHSHSDQSVTEQGHQMGCPGMQHMMGGHDMKRCGLKNCPAADSDKTQNAAKLCKCIDCGASAQSPTKGQSKGDK